MNTISILTPTDFAEAYQLEKRCHPIPWSKETFYSNHGDRYLNLKVTVKNKIVGFCICQIIADEATLFNVAIDPDFRRQGLGRALLSHLIEKLEQKGGPMPISTLWLEVRASNKGAITLYDSLGFNEITVRKNYYPTTNGQREDAIIMTYTCIL